MRHGPSGFRDLQRRCDDMSSSVLRQRLVEFGGARIVHQTPDGRYALTPLGDEVHQALSPLAQWSERWADALSREDPEC
ncbi:winged helix-turn-helix transcriptional regulator [Nonomuraea sp. NPDC048826]|uniref:winged helix-turn-helix transcriptional regulator n=1 Tax=Nonomuraea sp. NPDC048826 TaxID=3364347 RepID=UPI00372270F5